MGLIQGYWDKTPSLSPLGLMTHSYHFKRVFCIIVFFFLLLYFWYEVCTDLVSRVQGGGALISLTATSAAYSSSLSVLCFLVQTWLEWGDAHSELLSRVAPIANLPAPGAGTIDGTAAFAADGSSGFIFLFNPSVGDLNASLVVDESVHLPNSSTTTGTETAADTWTVQEIYPRHLTVGSWTHSEAVEVPVPAGTARILSLTKAAQSGWAITGVPGTIEVATTVPSLRQDSRHLAVHRNIQVCGVVVLISSFVSPLVLLLDGFC